MTRTLDYLQGLCDAATEGPWEADGEHITAPSVYSGFVIAKVNDDIPQEDFDLLAEARTALPAMIALIRTMGDCFHTLLVNSSLTEHQLLIVQEALAKLREFEETGGMG